MKAIPLNGTGVEIFLTHKNDEKEVYLMFQFLSVDAAKTFADLIALGIDNSGFALELDETEEIKTQ